MAYRRIAYAALLGGAVLFQIVFRFYLSTFTLALVLLLPLLSVLLSLPSVLGCTLLLTSAAPTVVQGEDAVFQVRLRSRTRLPLPRLQARLHWSNQLTGAGGRVRWEPVRTAPGAPPTLELATPHCGRLICRAERAWTCDLLGLFPLPIPTGRPAAVLILPPDMEQALPERLLGGGPGGGALLPRPGGGPGEDYDLRDYRPGDPLRSVHWKLSSKRDELVVRETLEPRQTTLVLTYDHFGAPAALDQTFARLCALSRALLERGRPHHIQWATPHCGRLICRAERAWTCDLLGLFPLPIPTGRPAAVLILPPDMEQALPERLLGGGPGGGALLPRPGGGPGEDYDLRDYRPGDPLRSVHWKLSSKRDELVVRETLEPRQTTLVLTYDHFGAPAALDQTFARLCALSRALLERGRPHHIQWASPTGGGVEGRLVDSERALLACLELAFSRPAPAEGRSILDTALRLPGRAGPLRHIHVTPTGLEGGAP